MKYYFVLCRAKPCSVEFVWENFVTVNVNVNAPRKLALSKSKRKEWLARNRDNVSEVAVDCQV